LPDSVRLRYTRGLQAADWYFPVAESLPQLRQDMQMFRKSAAVSSVLDLEALQRLIERWPQSGFERTEVYAQWHASLVSAISLAYFLAGNE
jgi:asparagine synthase (glutamine-hydrolysing)